MRLIRNDRTSPYFNLALEEVALTRMTDDVLILWRNEAAVIVGKNQNAAEEVDLDFVRQRNIAVVRRQSGGGAVFHDLGNVNFTIVRSMERGDFSNYEKFTAPVIGYLATLGVRAALQGRNDLVIDGMKFCGNAQAARGDRIMHHGCILYSADFSNLVGALRPRRAKIESKGVKSVRARVTNIADHMPRPLPVEAFLQGLEAYFAERMPGVARRDLTDEEADAARRLVEEKYATWEWNFGRAPAYNMENGARFAFGAVDVRLLVERGVVADISLSGDFFGARDVSVLETRLRGLRHERSAFEAALREYPVGEFISGMTAEELIDLVC